MLRPYLPLPVVSLPAVVIELVKPGTVIVVEFSVNVFGVINKVSIPSKNILAPSGTEIILSVPTILSFLIH